MSTAALALVAVVAAAHVFFFVLEALLWARPFGRRTFGMRREEAEATAVLAKNQGVYNLFLAAGLVWSMVIGDPGQAREVATFFLVCVLVAALVGAVTASWRILVVQGLPAAAALAAVWL